MRTWGWETAPSSHRYNDKASLMITIKIRWEQCKGKIADKCNELNLANVNKISKSATASEYTGKSLCVIIVHDIISVLECWRWLDIGTSNLFSINQRENSVVVIILMPFIIKLPLTVMWWFVFQNGWKPGWAYVFLNPHQLWHLVSGKGVSDVLSGQRLLTGQGSVVVLSL